MLYDFSDFLICDYKINTGHEPQSNAIMSSMYLIFGKIPFILN